MTDIESLIRVLTVLSILIGILSVVAPAFLFLWSKKYFPEKEDTVSPLHMEERFRTYTQERNQMLEKLSFDIREAFNVSIGRVESGEVTRHAELIRQVEDVRKGIREAFREAREAQQQAVQAVHRAELVESRVDGMEDLIEARLKHIEMLCEDRLPKRGTQ